jgi:hypothetical protein
VWRDPGAGATSRCGGVPQSSAPPACRPSRQRCAVAPGCSFCLFATADAAQARVPGAHGDARTATRGRGGWPGPLNTPPVFVFDRHHDPPASCPTRRRLSVGGWQDRLQGDAGARRPAVDHFVGGGELAAVWAGERIAVQRPARVVSTPGHPPGKAGEDIPINLHLALMCALS